MKKIKGYGSKQKLIKLIGEVIYCPNGEAILTDFRKREFFEISCIKA